jgi:hypothetical protein
METKKMNETKQVENIDQEIAAFASGAAAALTLTVVIQNDTRFFFDHSLFGWELREGRKEAAGGYALRRMQPRPGLLTSVVA